MATPKKFELLDHLEALLAGLNKPDLLPANFSMSVSGKRLGRAGLATALEAQAKPFNDLKAAEVALKAAQEAAKKATQAAKEFAAQVDEGFKATLTLRSPSLAVLDIRPKVDRPPMTTEQVLMRTLKANETRKRRGTLGPRQKRAIKATTVPQTMLVVNDSGVHRTAGSGSTPAKAKL
jgi:hypothetical protein